MNKNDYLRNDEAFVPELDFVMEQDSKLIGQNMFMKSVIKLLGSSHNRSMDLS